MERNNNRYFRLNEKQLGYMMVLPSILLIVFIALWPVAQSFYNSLFDYRLNDPNRSQKMISANVDLERYIDTHYYLQKSVENLKGTVEGEHEVLIESFIQSLHGLHEQLRQEPNVTERYEKVQEIIQALQPVRDRDLKYAKIENQLSEEYMAFLLTTEEEFRQLAEHSKDEEVASSFIETAEELVRLEDSILSSNFIGLANYQRYLQDDRMWRSLWNTLIFTVVSVFFELILGLFIALLIHRAFIGRSLVRVSVLIPWAIPTAVSAMMWRYLYDGQTGIVAHYFHQVGFISDASVLLSTAAGGLFSIIFADVWKTTPFMALLLLAGLQSIPHSLYEAAQVDGASRTQQFFRITLPLLKSAILIALLFRSLDAFRVFDLIFVLTGGGPANATESISIYAYKTLFSQQNFGAGSVLSVIVFLCVALISFLYIRFIGSELFAGRTRH